MTFVAFTTMLGVTLTRAQRVLVSVAYDGAQPRSFRGRDRELARQLFGGIDEIPPTARAVFVAVCGARAGKSYLGALYALWRALVADLSSLAPGEQASAVIVAPDLRLARQTLRYALGAARRVPSIASCIGSETSDGFVLRRPDGYSVAIECLPASRGGSAVRGRSLVCAVLDESAFFRDEQSVVNDADIFRAVAPRVIPGGLVTIVSTPWAEAGLLHELYIESFAHPVSALVAHAPTTLLRDDARTRAMVERERARDEANAAREFDATFMAVGTSLFFPSSVISAAMDPTLHPAFTRPDGVLVGVGADIGLIKDSSAIVAVYRRGAAFWVAECLEMRPQKGSPLKLSIVVDEFCSFAQRHGVSTIVVDHHALEPAREHLRTGYDLFEAPGGRDEKTERHVFARGLLTESQMRIPQQYGRLAEQLRLVTSQPTPAGGFAISSPRRGNAHGDIASAWVLACWSAGMASHFDDQTCGYASSYVIEQFRLDRGRL